MLENLRLNWSLVSEKITRALCRSGREGEEVTVVAVTKGHPPQVIQAALQAGITQIGENRVQEAEAKYRSLGAQARPGPEVHWHMVGHLQRNKAWDALKIFDMIQSVDSLRLAQELSRRLQASVVAGPVAQPGAEGPHARLGDGGLYPILIEVNTSGEPTKFGVAPEEALMLARQVADLPYLKVEGLMTLGPLAEDREAIRRSFSRLRELFEELRKIEGPTLEARYLSMGMSQDYEIAIEEGSNMVRLGTALFGERSLER